MAVAIRLSDLNQLGGRRGAAQPETDQHAAEAKDDVQKENIAKAEGDAAVGEKDAPNEKAAAVAENDIEKASAKPGLGLFVLAVAALVVFAFAISLAAPFLAGIQNVIGLLIIGFALWEAWRINAYRKLPITGPYELGAAPAA